MQQLTIPIYGTIKLNSFRPLCGNTLGLSAIEKYNFPPFIDASCRREPDFEHEFPSISALCRKGVFAPHLKIGDIIVYMTVDGYFAPYKKGHHLVAILQVEEVYDTHELGEAAYRNSGLPIPSNCMVTGNLPKDFDQTAGNFEKASQLKTFLSRTGILKSQIGKKRIEFWNNEYFEISKKWKCFVKTIPIYVNLGNPVLISTNDFNSIFGKLPNTRTPIKLTSAQLIELGKLVGLDIKLIQKRNDK